MIYLMGTANYLKRIFLFFLIYAIHWASEVRTWKLSNSSNIKKQKPKKKNELMSFPSSGTIVIFNQVEGYFRHSLNTFSFIDSRSRNRTFKILDFAVS